MNANCRGLLGCVVLLVASFARAAPPNIVIIMADDMGYSDIGCFGGEIDTPNIDRIAREGMTFTQFYNNAKCTTSRASLLSGMYPRGSGSRIPENIPTIAETMRAAGYQTGMSGKWHLGNQPPQRPYDRGFEEYYGLMDGAVNYFNPAQPDPAYKGSKVRSFGHNDRLVTEFPPGYYTTDAFADHAVATLRRFAQTGKPFFIHLAFNAPHYPLQAFPEDIAKYRGKYRQGWDELRRQRHKRQVSMGLVNPAWKLPPADSRAYGWSQANQDWEDLRMATYAAMVDRMDRNIGKVLRALHELGIEENTIVMFLSDNGGCTEEPGGRDDTQRPGIASTYTAVGPAWGFAQNTPFRRYKSWTHEGGISTPLLVRWPAQVKAGSRTSQMAHLIDILPTCLEVAGARPLQEMAGAPLPPLEGGSLVGVLRGETRATVAPLFWEWGGNCAVREGRWKAVWDAENAAAKWELYDIEADRTEMNDLAAQNPEIVARLSVAYADWARKLGRRLPERGPTRRKAGE